MQHNLAYLFAFFGLFLIASGVLSVLLLGRKAKTAIMSGGFFGVVALTAGHFLNQSQSWALYLGVAEAFLLTPIFAWRAGATFQKLLLLLQNGDAGAIKDKGTAFLIIASMFLMALVVLTLAVVFMQDVLAVVQ